MQLFANNAFSTLAGAITAAATTVSVQPGAGAKFPSPTAGDYFLVTLFQLIGGSEANHEVVKVTARSVDTLTIVRAQESTTARAWGVGDQLSLRGTAGTLGALAQLAAPNTFAVTPLVPTPTAGDNTTKTATTAFVTNAVSTAIAGLVASSPAALDTLNELALALGNDANYAATTSAALGNRLRIDVSTQGLTAAQKTNAVTNLGLAAVATSGAKADVGLSNVDNTSDANKPTTAAVTTALGLKANLAGAVFTGNVSVGDGVLAGVKQLGVLGNGYDLYAGTSGGTLFGFASTTLSSVFNTAAVPLGLGTNGAQPLIFGTSNAERMRIAAGGNVLIGSAIDGSAAKLQVNGDVAFGGASPGYTNFRTLAIGGVTGGVLEFIGSAVAVGNNRVAQIYAQSGYMAFLTYTSDASTERMRIASATGNLLIGTGTDNGTDKLQVTGSAIASKFITSTANGTAALVRFFQASQRDWTIGIPASSTALAFTDVSGTAEAMRIAVGGNLLIGTTTDNAVDKLQVNGSVIATGALKKINPAATASQFLSVAGSTTTQTYANITNTGGSLAFGVESSVGNSIFVSASAYASVLGTTNATSLQFAANNTVQATITSTGNVLIGTTADNGTDKLQVTGSASVVNGVKASSFSSVINGITTNISADANGSYIETLGVNNQRMYTNGAERVRITAAGNMGLGTPAPGVYANTVSMAIQGPQGALLDFCSAAVATGYNRVGQLYATVAAGLTFATGAGDALVERMRVTPAGNLLIGSTVDNGSDKLQVNGSAKITGQLAAMNFVTSVGATSCPNGQYTALFALPNIGLPATYLVTCGIGAANDAANYVSFMIVGTNGSAARAVMTNNAALNTLTLSGLSVLCSQGSGGSQLMAYSYTRIS